MAGSSWSAPGSRASAPPGACRGSASTCACSSARRAPGGRAASDAFEGFRFEPAGALISGADRELLAWVDELGLRDELLPLRPVVPAQVYRGRVDAIDPRGLFGVAAIPGVRRLHAARLVRLPRLLARYAPQLETDAPERAAPLDDRSLADFGALYFGESVVLRWMAPFVGSLGASPDTSRALFLRRYHTQAEALQGLPRATLAGLAEAVAARLMIQTGVEVTSIERPAAGGLRVLVRERGQERALEADAVVLAIGAPEAARVAGSLLGSGEREGLARVRYAPALAFVLGLRRALHSHPQCIAIPRCEGGPLGRVVLEPGVAGGRVPGGRGLAHLEASLEFACRSRRALRRRARQGAAGSLRAAVRRSARRLRVGPALSPAARHAALRRRPLPRDRPLRAHPARRTRLRPQALFRGRLPDGSVVERRAALRTASGARRERGPQRTLAGSRRAIVTPSPPSPGLAWVEAVDVGRRLQVSAHGVAQRAGSDAVHDREARAPLRHGAIQRLGQAIQGLVHAQTAQIAALRCVEARFGHAL